MEGKYDNESEDTFSENEPEQEKENDDISDILNHGEMESEIDSIARTQDENNGQETHKRSQRGQERVPKSRRLTFN